MGTTVNPEREVVRIGPPGAEMPVLVHRAGAGPVVAVTANLHGDEHTGTFAIFELDRMLPSTLRAGTALLYPTVNPRGLEAGTRSFPGGHDLNRLFPGLARGGLHQRVVRALWDDLLARGVEMVVDLHADSARSVPYAIVDRPLPDGAGAALGPTLGRLAEAAGLLALWEYPEAQYRRYGLDRSLTGALVNRAGIPAITVEAGPRRWVDPRSIHVAVGAVLRLLRHWGLVDRAPAAPVQLVPRRSWRRAPAPAPEVEGLFVEGLAPGTAFEAGDQLGEIVDLAGGVRCGLRAARAGVVVSWVEGAWVKAGRAVGMLAVEEDGA